MFQFISRHWRTAPPAPAGTGPTWPCMALNAAGASSLACALALLPGAALGTTALANAAPAKPVQPSQAVLQPSVPPLEAPNALQPPSHPMGNSDPCREWAKRLPNINTQQCRAAELRPSIGRSLQKVPIYTRDVMAPDAKLRVLVIGGIHGDELSSSSLALHWIQMALEIPSNAHWRFIPLLNPDGMLRPKPQRMNGNGVDLNRNFPTPNWDRDAKYYWEQRTRKDPRRWPGPTPLSEPETRYLHEEMERFAPNLIVSIHAPYGVLDFDGPGTPPPKLGRLYLDQVGIFPGSLGNYSGVHKGRPVVTIELPNAYRTPLNVEMRQMWLDLLRWMSERITG